ncbi:hypothetical protein BH20ACT1_BH20ACT1_12520 [soil metagenome]|jgi:hypothetical protein
MTESKVVGVADVDAVAQVVAQCPSVARLTRGSGVEAVAYLPGRRVEGIRIVDDHLEVHVVARYGPTMSEVADEIRLALRPTLGEGPVAIVIDDLDLDPDLEPEGGAAAMEAGG